MKLFEKWGLSAAKLKEKNTWLVLGIIGLLLLVIALPDGASEQTNQAESSGGETETVSAESPTDTAKELEERLSQTLSLIDGAGAVRVMVTFQDNGERVIEKDVSRRSDSGENGTSDTEEAYSSVYTQEGSTQVPYVASERTPQVEGVLVVAQGGGDSIVKQNLLQAVMSLFPLDAHKITIVKMSMQEVRDHEDF